MKILLDTNVLLNDFFHRHPDFGFQRIQDPVQLKEVESYRAIVHEALLFISLQKNVETTCTTCIIGRLASILGDLLVPADLVLEEIQHWLSNVKLIELDGNDLHLAINNMEASKVKLDFDDYLLKHLAVKNGIDLVLTSIPKSREFYWPVLVFKPEKIREINFSELSSQFSSQSPGV